MTEPRRYPRGAQVNATVRQLIEDGVLSVRPRQVDRSDLTSSDGVDIVYELRNMTPDRFPRHVDQLLAAANYEANRYSDFDYFYGSWSVRLNTGSGRRSAENTRVYTAAMSGNLDEMIWGDGRMAPAELGGQGRSLSHKAEAILNMLQSGSPGAYVNQQSPYRVLRMVISVRLRPESMDLTIRDRDDTSYSRVTRPGGS